MPKSGVVSAGCANIVAVCIDSNQVSPIAIGNSFDIAISFSNFLKLFENPTKIAIEKTLAACGITNCKVYIYDGLIAKFAKENNIKYMIRGLRNNLDYNYEENIAEVNKLINPEMEYIYFRADNIAVSSSMVRELNCYNQDISQYVSKDVLEFIKNSK